MEQGHDSRLQQQHPFPHNQTSYPPPAQNQSHFAVSQHPQSTPQPYINQNRRRSDPYYDQQISYGQDAHSLNHARHPVGTAINHGVAAHLSIPPIPSPQQQAQSGTHQSYVPPPSRVPTGSVGVAASFPGNRDHTGLPPVSCSRAGGIAIADILGGPSHQSVTQYNSIAQAAGPIFGSTPTSPSMSIRRSDYTPYHHSEIPEHSRKVDRRDSRVNSAGPQPGPDHYKPPESQRYDTPQLMHQPYLQRGISHEERKESPQKMNINAPPRPSSQPISYKVPQPSDSDQSDVKFILSRKIDPAKRKKESSSYNRSVSKEIERHKSFTFSEKDRIREQQQKPEAAIKRDRERDKMEQKEPINYSNNNNNNQRDYAMQVPQKKVWYSRPQEPQDWVQNGAYEIPRPAYEPIPDRDGQPARHPINNYDYSLASAPQYTAQLVHVPNEHRNGLACSLAPQNNSMNDINRQERHGPTQQMNTFTATPQNGSFPSHEPDGRNSTEETQPVQQRNFLGIQEVNRKVQASPLPQSAQGMQNQADGPSGEPSIKNEFGRMFSGIGSGVGSALRAPSPIVGQGFPIISGLRREELESLQEMQSINEPQAAAIQGSKRRKIQDDKGDDDTTIDRNSPNRRVKRTKTNFHQNQRLIDSVEPNCSSKQNKIPLKTLNSTLSFLQQTDDKPNVNLHHHHYHHHHVAARHHHHHISGNKGLAVASIPSTHKITPLPKLSILNDGVLTSVAHLPRHHLGYGYYGSTLKASSYPISFNRDSGSTRGFTSTPDALPLFAGRENCTYTVKIPRIYLEDFVREEVTSRKAIWGTDIYTDDSDVLAACIHAGWFRGAWPEDVDVSLLGLELKNDENNDPIPPDEIQENQLLENPSEKGPSHIPPGCDCHVTILILPLLDHYASSTRFGIKSREWGMERGGWKGKHDGLSFMIKSVRFVSGVNGEEGKSGRNRCKILKRKLKEKETNSTKHHWMNCQRIEKDGSSQGDFEKDITKMGDFVGLRGLGMGGWWKRYSNFSSCREEKITCKAQPLKDCGAKSRIAVCSERRSSTHPYVGEPPGAEIFPSLSTHDTLTNLQRSEIISQITETMKINANYNGPRVFAELTDETPPPKLVL